MKHLHRYVIYLQLLSWSALVCGFTLKGKRNGDTFAEERSNSTCTTVDVDTSARFGELNFHASWIWKKYFWNSEDFDFENRYEKHKNAIFNSQQTIKVFVLPHSHTDPGWLNTYELYYAMQIRHILDNAVAKLEALPEMTFLWNEITYLSRWWQDTSHERRAQFRKLVEEGRLEISTGGWVMPDEATPSLYSLVHELTEGQQWLKNYLNHKPKYAWAIDPFGHSSTFSHLLKAADMEGMVVQRLHYAWKHWLAEHKTEDFFWRPRWDNSGASDISCLTLPYDLYSIKHACGPEPQVCLKFDFRQIKYEYGENYGLMTPISIRNIKKASQEIATQYQKTASLTNHNVVLVPLGDDFRYDQPLEWDQQYSNYMQLFSYINSHQDKFRMQIKFGTLRDYFEEINKFNANSEQRPSLSGDFFPYGDVYVSGKPAYWTGFYGSRPYWKRFYRELENELRSAEILFAYANVLAAQDHVPESYLKLLRQQYADLVTARREFALFAHHDGVTGTSNRWTMDDYGYRLHTAYTKSIAVQSASLKILHKTILNKDLPDISKDYMRESFARLPAKIPVEIFDNDDYTSTILLFNNLGWRRTEVVKVLVKKFTVLVTDSQGQHIPSQINPVLLRHEYFNQSKVEISDRLYELVFLASLEPLSLSVYHIRRGHAGSADSSKIASVQCAECRNIRDTIFAVENENDAQQEENPMMIKNSRMTLYFQRNGLLQRMHSEAENKTHNVSLSFGLYRPIKQESGAYLLKPNLSVDHMFFEDVSSQVIKITGPIMSQVIATHSTQYETIQVNTTLFNTTDIPDDSLSSSNETLGVLLQTFVDFTREYSSAVEVFMRLDTSLRTLSQQIINDKHFLTPTMYTDQNGFVSERRIHSPSVGYEGNTYPVTTMSYVEDDEQKVRFSVLVDRTHGFCSMQSGRLETLIERRSTYGDKRGMSEGVTDSKPTISSYLLLLESLDNWGDDHVQGGDDEEQFSEWQPTLGAYKTSLRHTYPPNMFVYNAPQDDSLDEDISLVSSPLPNNVHLLNLRTLSLLMHANNTQQRYSPPESPGKVALMNLQYLPTFKDNYGKCNRSSTVAEKQILTKLMPAFSLNRMNISKVTLTSLTGVINDDVPAPVRKGSAARGNSLLVNLKLFFP